MSPTTDTLPITIDVLLGTDAAFDPRIHAARPHPAWQATAASQVRWFRGCYPAPEVISKSYLDDLAGRAQPCLS